MGAKGKVLHAGLHKGNAKRKYMNIRRESSLIMNRGGKITKLWDLKKLGKNTNPQRQELLKKIIKSEFILFSIIEAIT